MGSLTHSEVCMGSRGDGWSGKMGGSRVGDSCVKCDKTVFKNSFFFLKKDGCSTAT